jgi:hypothetical protein
VASLTDMVQLHELRRFPQDWQQGLTYLLGLREPRLEYVAPSGSRGRCEPPDHQKAVRRLGKLILRYRNEFGSSRRRNPLQALEDFEPKRDRIAIVPTVINPMGEEARPHGVFRSGMLWSSGGPTRKRS